jgi:hypothetical protein
MTYGSNPYDHDPANYRAPFRDRTLIARVDELERRMNRMDKKLERRDRKFDKIKRQLETLTTVVRLK